MRGVTGVLGGEGCRGEVPSLDFGEYLGDVSSIARLELSCIPNNRAIFLSLGCRCGIVCDRFGSGRFSFSMGPCFLSEGPVRKFGEEGERGIDGRWYLSFGSSSFWLRTAVTSVLAIMLGDLFRTKLGGALRLLLGPILLPRPGLALLSNCLSEKDVTSLPWSDASDIPDCGRATSERGCASEIVLKALLRFVAVTNADRGRFDDGARVRKLLSILGVSKMVGVFGESKVGRFSLAACL